LKSNECADRDDIVLIPFRVTVLQEHEDREEDIEPELEDLEVRSSHRGYGSRGIAGVLPLTSLLTSSAKGVPINIAGRFGMPPFAFNLHHASFKACPLRETHPRCEG